MPAEILAHAAFDLAYGASVACLIGRCEHRRHRIGVQVVAALIGALILVHLVG